MENRLIDQIQKKQLFESYPMQWINSDSIEENDIAVVTLYNLVETLHSYNIESDGLREFFAVIDKEDFRDIIMFLTNKLYILLENERTEISE